MSRYDASSVNNGSGILMIAGAIIMAIAAGALLGWAGVVLVSGGVMFLTGYTIQIGLAVAFALRRQQERS